MKHLNFHFTITKPSLTQSWLLMLGVVFLVTIILAIYAVRSFIHVAGADATSDAGDSGVESVSRESLHELLSVFERRSRTFQSLQSSYEAPADPSM